MPNAVETTVSLEEYDRRILRLADMIEKSETYDQRKWTCPGNAKEPCDTPACIAGHACVLTGAKSLSCDSWEFDGHIYETPVLAQAWMGLSDDEADELFTPSPRLVNGPDAPCTPTPELAAKVLRNFVETGDVNWMISTD